MKENRFDIDFFEFSFLVEACIPKRPIARTMFFERVIDEYFYILTDNERQRLHEWIGKNHSFKYELEKGEELCVAFDKRFDMNNNYNVTTKFEGKIQTDLCYLLNGKYYTKTDTYANEKYITKIEKYVAKKQQNK